MTDEQLYVIGSRIPDYQYEFPGYRDLKTTIPVRRFTSDIEEDDEKYLYEKALRRVAIIISRKGADENALAAVRGSFRESGKLILCLSDRDILEMMEIKEWKEQPTEAFLGAMLDDLLIHLEK